MAILNSKVLVYMGRLANAEADMSKIKSTRYAKSLAASGAASANNHVAFAEAPGRKARLSACPVMPSHDQIVGADSGVIKPPKRPDD